MDMGLCGIECRPSLQPSVPLLGQGSQPGLVPELHSQVQVHHMGSHRKWLTELGSYVGTMKSLAWGHCSWEG